MVEEDGKVKTASHLHSKEETTADTTNRENDLRGCRTDHLPLGKKSRPLEYCKGGTVIDGGPSPSPIQAHKKEGEEQSAEEINAQEPSTPGPVYLLWEIQVHI